MKFKERIENMNLSRTSITLCWMKWIRKFKWIHQEFNMIMIESNKVLTKVLSIFLDSQKLHKKEYRILIIIKILFYIHQTLVNLDIFPLKNTDRVFLPLFKEKSENPIYIQIKVDIIRIMFHRWIVIIMGICMSQDTINIKVNNLLIFIKNLNKLII